MQDLKNRTLSLVLLSIHIAPGSRAVPLGAAMVASSLKKHFGDALSITMVDAYLDQDDEEILESIRSVNARVVGFSIYLWSRKKSLKLVEHLRAENPDLIIFAGGPEVSADPRELNRQSGAAFSFLIPGEGEAAILHSFRHLLAGEDPRDLPLLAEPVLPRLEELPSPYLDGTLDLQRYSGLLWELSRGCPFRCDFCFESRGVGGVRPFASERIRAELDAFVQAGVEELFVLDPTFNFKPARAKGLLQLFAERAPGIHYNIEVRSEFLDEETAELLSMLSVSVQIGMQSAHPEVLHNINRSIDRDAFFQRVLFLHRYGVTYGFDLIYGLPGDSFQGFLESIDFALSMLPNHLDLFPLAVLPGTRLSETADALGLKYQREDPYIVQYSDSFPTGDMARAKAVSAAVQCFYNDAGGVTWFDLLCAPLDLSPSQFFLSCADWMQGRGDESPEAFAKAYIRHCYGGQGLSRESADLAEDIISFFSSDGQPRYFHYHPGELYEHLSSGVREIEELAFFTSHLDASASVLPISDGYEIRLEADGA